jgi:hypothetical protein
VPIGVSGSSYLSMRARHYVHTSLCMYVSVSPNPPKIPQKRNWEPGRDFILCPDPDQTLNLGTDLALPW